MVRLGFLVTPPIEIIAEVPMQAKDIMDREAMNPPNPPRQNPPSALEKKLAASTWGTPNTMNIPSDISRVTVIRFSIRVSTREPRMVQTNPSVRTSTENGIWKLLTCGHSCSTNCVIASECPASTKADAIWNQADTPVSRGGNTIDRAA